MGLFNDIKNGISNLFNINNYSALSYATLLNDIQKFKKSGTNSGSEFNYFDTKGHKYFKILFYFGQDTTDAGFSSGGLLAPTWNEFGDITEKISEEESVSYNIYDSSNYVKKALELQDMETLNKIVNIHDYNSAWSYLMLNNENQRAKHLEQFVNLLSNINSESPWYFMAIEGIGDGMERKMASDGKVEIGETKKLTIKCIEDAFDNRLTTLLELYRDITWSWTMKKEILPANLRKFDMAIYIFESPITKWHENEDTIDSVSGYQPSYKMLEFHNCEIDYNSIKSGWGEFSNEGGLQTKYSIEIKYDDCYEISYNEFIMEKLGDIILSDYYVQQNTADVDRYNDYNSNSYSPLISNLSYFNNVDKNTQLTGLNKRSNPYDKGFLGNAIGQVIGMGVNYLEDKLERAILGNLHTASLTKIGSQVKDLMNGNVIKTVQAANDYIEAAEKRKEDANKTPPKNNIAINNKYDRPVEFKNTDYDLNGNLFEDINISHEQPNGNIFTKGNIFSNIFINYNNLIKEQPTGNITSQQIAALKMKEKPKGKIFDNITLINNI